MAYYSNTKKPNSIAPPPRVPTSNNLPPRVPSGAIVYVFGEGTLESPMIAWLRIPRHPDPVLAGRVERLAVRAAIKMEKKCFYIRSVPHDSLGYIDEQGQYNRYLGMDWHICYNAGDHPFLANTQGDIFYKEDYDNEFFPMKDEERSDWRNVLPRPLRGIEVFPYPKLNQDESRVRPRGQLPPRPKEDVPLPPEIDVLSEEEMDDFEEPKTEEATIPQNMNGHGTQLGRGGIRGHLQMRGARARGRAGYRGGIRGGHRGKVRVATEPTPLPHVDNEGWQIVVHKNKRK